MLNLFFDQKSHVAFLYIVVLIPAPSYDITSRYLKIRRGPSGLERNAFSDVFILERAFLGPTWNKLYDIATLSTSFSTNGIRY